MRDLSDNLKSNVLNLSEERAALWRKVRQPLTVHLEITPHCNFKCVHCYMQKVHNANQLSLTKIKRIIDRLYDIGVLFLTFTGGEIFTRKDFSEIYMYAKRKGFIIELFTNGYCITDEIVAMLKKYPPLLVDVSLYGGCDETYYQVTGIKGALECVIKNCRKLVDAGIRVAIKSPVLTLTYPEIDLMKNIAKKLGVLFRCSFELITTLDNDDISKKYQVPISDILNYEFNEFLSSGSTIENIENTIPARENLFYCRIGRNSFIIDYHGNICPCMKFRHKGVPFLECDFDQVWSDYEKFSKISLPENHKCYKCKNFYYCDNCPAEMDFVYGDMYHCDENQCMIARKRAEFYDRYYGTDIGG